MIKKVISVIILTLVSIICTSCVGIRELDELGIVTAIALDMENEKIILTNEVVIPSATESDSPIEDKVIYVQSEGDTIFEAYRNATLEFDRRLFVSHNMAVILGEEFAKRGIGDYMVDFLNDTETRESAYILVAKNVKGYELLGTKIGLSPTSGDYLAKLVENHKNNLKTRDIKVFEYFKYFFQDRAPVLGVVQEVEKMEIKQEEKEDTPKKIVLNVGGGAVFKGDKLKGYYTENEIIGFNFMTNHIKGGLLVFEVFDRKSDKDHLVANEGRFTAMEIKSSRTKKDIKIVDGQIHLDINVRIKAILAEETKGLRTTELDVKDAIEETCSDKVEEYIKMVMDKAQNDFQIDNLGIEDLVYIKYPKIWKEISDDWDKGIFPDISYNVTVDTKMIRTDLINIPTNIKKGKEEW